MYRSTCQETKFRFWHKNFKSLIDKFRFLNYTKSRKSRKRNFKKGVNHLSAAVYPTLIGEIAKRGIKKSVIASRLGISERSLYNKLHGNVSFTWPEVQTITTCFFPDLTPTELFETENGHTT